MTASVDVQAARVLTQESLLASATRKNLVRLVPIVAVAYFFNYIDRTNVGFAALHMNRDLGLSNAEFGAAAGMFFIGYCLLEVPSNIVLYRVGARRWLARIMISSFEVARLNRIRTFGSIVFASCKPSRGGRQACPSTAREFADGSRPSAASIGVKVHPEAPTITTALARPKRQP